MGNLRRRILLAERSAQSKARHNRELRVSGKSLEEARSEFVQRLLQAASRPGVPANTKVELEEAAERIAFNLKEKL